MSDANATRREFCTAAGGAAVVGLPSVELVSPPEPSVEWTATVEGGADLRIVGDTAFVGGRDLRALDPADGSERWRVDFDGDLDPDVDALGDDAVFVSHYPNLHAYEATSGEHRWTMDDAGWPAYHDGVVYAVKHDTRYVVAVDAADASERWTADLDVQPLPSPVVADGTLYVGDRDALHALDAATGDARWTFSVENGDFVHPALAYGEVGGSSATVAGVVPVWSVENGTLLGVSAADGTEQWRVERVPESNSPPVARHDDALVVASETHLTAYDAATGAERWRVETSGVGWPRVAGDAVYLSGVDAIHAVDAVTGARRWRSRLDSERPVHLGEVADGTVSISSWDGWVAALDAADGALGWRHRHGGEPAWFPAVADGTVYLGTRDGRAMALSEPDSPGSPLRRLTPSALAGGLGVAGALAATGYHRLRSRPDADR